MKPEIHCSFWASDMIVASMLCCRSMPAPAAKEVINRYITICSRRNRRLPVADIRWPVYSSCLTFYHEIQGWINHIFGTSLLRTYLDVYNEGDPNDDGKSINRIYRIAMRD